jgi:hypothetical protein
MLRLHPLPQTVIDVRVWWYETLSGLLLTGRQASLKGYVPGTALLRERDFARNSHYSPGTKISEPLEALSVVPREPPFIVFMYELLLFMWMRAVAP